MKTFKIIVAVVSGLLVLSLFTIGLPVAILKLGKFISFLFDGGIGGCYFIAAMLIVLGVGFGVLMTGIVGDAWLNLGWSKEND